LGREERTNGGQAFWYVSIHLPIYESDFKVLYSNKNKKEFVLPESFKN